jgi:uroporphyrinogen-III synthase
VTSETARGLGIVVDAEAKEFTLDGLIQALLDARP